jgi:hypothetical protein
VPFIIGTALQIQTEREKLFDNSASVTPWGVLLRHWATLCILIGILGVTRPGREADHSPPSCAEVKEWVELYLHSPNTPSWRGAQLRHRDNFYLFITIKSCWQNGRH